VKLRRIDEWQPARSGRHCGPDHARAPSRPRPRRPLPAAPATPRSALPPRLQHLPESPPHLARAVWLVVL